MFKRVLLILVVLIRVNDCFAEEDCFYKFARDGWQKKDKGIYETSLTSIVITSSGKLFASTDKAIYTSNDKADTWGRMIFMSKSSTNINGIDCTDGKVYAATTDGLYKIASQAGDIRRIFKAWGDKKYVNCIKIKNGELYIGTKRGLFISSDNGMHWKSVDFFKNKQINDIAFLALDSEIFIAADDGIYKDSESSNKWTKTFKKAIEEKDEEENNNNENETEESVTNFLTTDLDAKAIYVKTNKKILVSHDEGKNWLPNSEIAIPYNTKRLIHDKNNECAYAATSDGLYKYVFAERKDKIDEKDDYADFIKGQIKNEPSIQQIYEAAIEYAEVSPEKIKKMRMAARDKAWLPKLSVGVDYDADTNIDIDRGGTNDTDVYIIGPDEENWGWGINLSWDLGELIWNDDQTNIDVRSKLMVQLRDDILTEITTLYFERRRLQLDIADGKYKGKAQDKAMLRLQELTARIDALTGGYLSKHREEL